MTELTIPTNARQWADELNKTARRPGWGKWDITGNSVLEGVQNWSIKGDETNSCGVWGNVVETEGEPDADLNPITERYVNWCVYWSDCRDPHKSGFSSAEAAMIQAENDFRDCF